MGRKTSQTTVVAADNTLEVLPALAEAANALAARSSEISKQFGDGLPYERHRVVNEARFYMAQSAEAMLEAGKRLILLKENEPHGDFTSIVEEQLGLAPRTARLMIQAAVKYSSPQLESKRQALAVLGKTKLFELMTEDDEELAALADGGSIAGMDLDDIDRMTSRELRAALREAHENATAQARLLSDKNAKIDELAAKKTRVKRITPDEEGAEIRKETSAIAFEAESVIRGNLRAAFETLTQHAETHGAPHDDFMAGVLGQIQLSLNQLRSEFSVKAAADGDDVPQWLRDTSAGSADADFSRAAN
ncbi:DUF3102 domain-containing protein [Burkholderia lata]|uniref:DUF3102 domain-containing protein n=1 Tax=Burkholderia lata (strain ATCC 17760 / DSM 23089 / LMG 22485 / NCIMB 9086 / R18194 / 383) TaxID=482957 RepID=UPI000F08701A|nr:DUF3102 domain-containing protein [Burkholderia lata]AYQ43817.1 DUF3102 domain-containing protein [Burkholderia lata]